MPEPKNAPQPPSAPAAPRRPPPTLGRGIGVVAITFVALLVGLFFIDIVQQNLGLAERPVALGATFSKSYADSLGIDWKAAYTAMLDDLQVRHLRIPAYWDDIEAKQGTFDFTNVDWQVAEAAKRGATIILGFGRKQPRWPECHVPDWTKGMPESLVQTRLLEMVEKVVRHYDTDPAIKVWQVENEPFLPFGDCPKADRDFLKREVSVVRAIDPTRPIMITESGELSSWLGPAGIADVLGISTYRTVWDKYLGYLYWPVTPKYYQERYRAVSALFSDTGPYITELQAEPWTPQGIDSLSVDQQLRLMNPTKLEDNARFAREVGFPQAYLWGIEWWYWLKEKKGHPELWDEGKKIYAAANAAEAAGKTVK